MICTHKYTEITQLYRKKKSHVVQYYWLDRLQISLTSDITYFTSTLLQWHRHSIARLIISPAILTGHFIMFSVITNIYNKKTKGPTLMELFTATGKLKTFFFWQLEMLDVCTNLNVCNNLNIISMCAVSPVVHTSSISSCQKKSFQFSCGCEQFH